MGNRNYIPNIYLRSLYHILMLAGIFLLTLFLMTYIAGSLIKLIWGFESAQILDNPEEPKYRDPLTLIQICSQLGIFFSGIIYIMLVEKFWDKTIFKASRRPIWDIILIFILMISINPFIGWIQDLNKDLVLYVSGDNSWAVAIEEKAEKLTNTLTQISSVGAFISMLFVVAILPAIGEELVFRGIIQRKLSHNMNPHLAIWIAALIFSLVHFQMFGLIPRMILGAVLGYLYYWSKSLMLAIYAHFLNNGLALFAIYINQKELAKINESKDISIYLLISFTILSVGILLLIQRYYARIEKRDNQLSSFHSTNNN